MYFVTICTFGRANLFGSVCDETMILNLWGRIVEEEWLKSADIRPHLLLDAYVIMPNHLHGIIGIIDEFAGRDQNPIHSSLGKQRTAGAGGLASGSLGAVIGQFKSIVSKRIGQLGDGDDAPLIWQRGYHDHIIRDDNDLNRSREYVAANPARWSEDSLYGSG